MLPVSVQNQGITILKTPDILNIINFYSPDRYDDTYLSSLPVVYGEALRIDGVSQINTLGVSSYSMRAWLDRRSCVVGHERPATYAIRNRTSTPPER